VVTGNKLSITSTCPSAGLRRDFYFTATGGTLTMYNYGDHTVTVLVKQP
jgi:hypothetical protein